MAMTVVAGAGSFFGEVVMSGRDRTARILVSALSVPAACLALPVDAQQPVPPASATSAFDGRYVGVSAENDSRGNTLAGSRASPQGYAGSRGCRSFRAPPRLTIANGFAQLKWGEYTLYGSPTAKGGLALTSGYGQRFEGQIDSQYLIKGQLVGYCTYTLTWRKAG
jgi:hypothetical protein